MGGEHSGIADDTVDVFESAWFNPLAIVGKARMATHHASHRYERGVDKLQVTAMHRARN